MATMNIQKGAYADYTEFAQSFIFTEPANRVYEATKIVFFADQDLYEDGRAYAEAIGSFQYNIADELIGGTITRLDQISETGFPGSITTGLSVDAVTFIEFVDSNDPFGLLAYLFEGNDTINGNSKDDILSGFDGDDVVRGRGRDDIIAGGNGEDTLIGGGGDDTFYVTGEPKRANLDEIDDYNDKRDDILLDRDWYNLPEGKLAKGSFYVGNKAKDESDRIIYDKDDGKILYDADGSGSDKAVLVAKIEKGLDGLRAGDFYVEHLDLFG